MTITLNNRICTHSHTCAWDAPDALRRIRSGRYTSAEEFDPQRRLALQLHGAYTFGKSIDTLSATVATDAFPNGLFNQLFFDQRTTRGLSDFDVRQNFAFNFTWAVPSLKTRLGAAQWAFGGWQLGGIYRASSGQPFTPPSGWRSSRYEVGSDQRAAGPACGPRLRHADQPWES